MKEDNEKEIMTVKTDKESKSGEIVIKSTDNLEDVLQKTLEKTGLTLEEFLETVEEAKEDIYNEKFRDKLEEK